MSRKIDFQDFNVMKIFNMKNPGRLMGRFIALALFMIPFIAFSQNRNEAADPSTISDTWVATDALGRKLPGYEDVGKKFSRFIKLEFLLFVDTLITVKGF